MPGLMLSRTRGAPPLASCRRIVGESIVVRASDAAARRRTPLFATCLAAAAIAAGCSRSSTETPAPRGPTAPPAISAPAAHVTSASAALGERMVGVGDFGIVVHGGAGTIERSSMSPEREREYRETLTQAIRAGWQVLNRGGNSLDAVVATIRILEDSPLFNAGKGAVFTADGRNELDASIMWGPTQAAGAVAGVTQVRSPITLARAVMEKSKHVFMAREGAEAFAREQGIELVDPQYFFTQHRHDQLQRAKEAERRSGVSTDPRDADIKFGTVGAVALDKQGNIAAGTSTGGMTNKRFGRIGDAPVIGAGTFASKKCGVSATGHGEFFIRNVVAYDICALADYRNMPIRDAADAVIMFKLVDIGAEGGVVAMDADGTIAMSFNSAGMYRGFARADGTIEVAIYRDE